MIEKKLAPVAPIIRRKHGGAAEPAVAAVVAEASPIVPFSAGEDATVTSLPIPPMPLPPGVSVESVARFFGINKG